MVGWVVWGALALRVVAEDDWPEPALVAPVVSALACGAPLAVGCCSMLGAV